MERGPFCRMILKIILSTGSIVKYFPSRVEFAPQKSRESRTKFALFLVGTKPVISSPGSFSLSLNAQIQSPPSALSQWRVYFIWYFLHVNKSISTDWKQILYCATGIERERTREGMKRITLTARMEVASPGENNSHYQLHDKCPVAIKLNYSFQKIIPRHKFLNARAERENNFTYIYHKSFYIK